MIAAIVLVQFVGIPFAFLFGALAGRIGTKPAIFLGIAGYVLITFLGWRLQTSRDFLLLAALVGMVQGGTQALSRSLFARMIPKRKSGEFFGFFAIFEKFAGILGPLLFSLAVYATGSSRTAILTTLVFFVAGAALLLKVDVARGEWDATRVGPDPAPASDQEAVFTVPDSGRTASWRLVLLPVSTTVPRLPLPWRPRWPRCPPRLGSMPGCAPSPRRALGHGDSHPGADRPVDLAGAGSCPEALAGPGCPGPARGWSALAASSAGAARGSADGTMPEVRGQVSALPDPRTECRS